MITIAKRGSLFIRPIYPFPPHYPKAIDLERSPAALYTSAPFFGIPPFFLWPWPSVAGISQMRSLHVICGLAAVAISCVGFGLRAQETAGAAVGDASKSATRAGPAPVGLPKHHGQIWKEYDLRRYTTRITTTSRPEQAVIDWILRETGTEVWFSEPLGLLSADRDVLRVYHTQEMHQLVQGVVDRLVESNGEPYALGVRLVTVNNPNWRGRALPLLQSVTVQSPGVDAWLLSKEIAAVLLGDLRQRADFKEHQSPVLAIPNGQSQTMSRLRPRNYVRWMRMTNTAIGYELETSQIQEGYSLQISPLMSLDGKTIDAVVKCQIDQIEHLIPVTVDGPARQSVRIEVPQIVSWRLHERFRWSTDAVLLLSCGVVAAPSEVPATSRPLPRLMGSVPSRADALLFIECLGPANQAMVESARTAEQRESLGRGRY
jgi:hypothetical protein